MSTPPNRIPKTASKRRAERRKRMRDIGRHVFAYGVIALMVLGTISSVIISPTGVPAGLTPVPIATQPTDNTFQQLVTLGDQAITRGDMLSAYSFYSAYMSENPNDARVASKMEGALIQLPAAADQAVTAGQWVSATNILETYARAKSTDGDAQLKLAKTILASPQPDFVKAAAALERATKIPGSPAVAEAQALLQQHQAAIQTAVAAAPPLTGTVGITSTVGVTSTTGVTSPISPAVTITSTVPLSPTTSP